MASVIVTIPMADVARARMLAQMLTESLRSSAGILISVSPDSEAAGVTGTASASPSA